MVSKKTCKQERSVQPQNARFSGQLFKNALSKCCFREARSTWRQKDRIFRCKLATLVTFPVARGKCKLAAASSKIQKEVSVCKLAAASEGANWPHSIGPRSRSMKPYSESCLEKINPVSRKSILSPENQCSNLHEKGCFARTAFEPSCALAPW